MIDKTLFASTTIPLLHRSLDAFALRQKAIANNVANAETPGYKRWEVNFEEKLKQALEASARGLDRTHPSHLPRPADLEEVMPELQEDQGEDYFNGINNVNLDQEMASLAKTQLAFRFAARMSRNEFEMLRTAIRGTNL